MPSERKEIQSLQIYRGIAALAVVFHHGWNSFSYFCQIENYFFDFLSSVGKNGVDFFFVLSGFIITYSNYHKANRISQVKNYFIKRVIRVYVPYIPISLVMILSYHVFPSMSHEDRETSLITSLFLIPHGSPVLSVAWTLIHEMLFYLVFMIWFFSRRGFILVIFIWSLIILTNHYSMTMEPGTFMKYLISTYNLEFILGVVGALWYMQNKHRKLVSIYVLGVFLLFLSLFMRYYDVLGINNVILVFSFLLLILGSSSVESTKTMSSKVLLLLGNASYSIYLIHNPEISVLFRVLPFSNGYVYDWVLLATVFVICCLTGIIYSRVFEQYLMKRVKAKILLYSETKISWFDRRK